MLDGSSLQSFAMMTSIIENDLRRFDLNLLLVFHALMQERHVTRAAERLFLGQPAVSGALKRLRAAFGDELFVRGRSGMEPTPRALELSRQIDALLIGLHETMRAGQPFDARNADRTFRIGVSEAIAVTLFPALLKMLAAEAPGVKLISLDTDCHRVSSMFERNEIEIALGVFNECAPWQQQRVLLDWRFVCLYNPKLIRPRGESLSLREFLAHPHALTSFKGELSGFIDERLASLGKQRRVIFSNPHFATQPFIARDNPVLVTVPDYIARIWSRSLGLRISPLPFDTPMHQVSALWKTAHQGDSGLRWLIGLTEQAARMN
ncbi:MULTISPECIES: LysR family transcriptional regulator [Burkholderia]|nr:MULTISPECIES: LysR family transcriptional regulator [Burkholderia]MEB4629541.1 LysR family transcriptional regulator [Burkholderia contaminans]MEB4635723.1 LysR family transcriptional regulator [Burkholderia contaminans]MEB4651055.1 LysR family transcriptional regulator [Burkholderia contaminans]MEB4666334.1 LysR family transcriptional regulator [Burkholderia contaminans]MEB4680256.1 LysR family transcriptional regulator [Burkholderia contaminans]